MNLTRLWKNRKGQMAGGIAGLVITLIMGIIVAGVIISNVNTDAILGSTTTSVTNIQNIAMVGFTIAGVGMIAYAGYWIINVFQ